MKDGMTKDTINYYKKIGLFPTWDEDFSMYNIEGYEIDYVMLNQKSNTYFLHIFSDNNPSNNKFLIAGIPFPVSIREVTPDAVITKYYEELIVKSIIKLHTEIITAKLDHELDMRLMRIGDIDMWLMAQNAHYREDVKILYDESRESR